MAPGMKSFLYGMGRSVVSVSCSNSPSTPFSCCACPGMDPLVNAVQALHEICVKKGTAYEPYVLEVHQAASYCIM